jgi:hypothetical protein
MTPLGEVLLLARGSVPLPEDLLLTSVAAEMLGLTEPRLFGLASSAGVRPFRHNCGRGSLVDCWRLVDLNKLVRRRFSNADIAVAEDKAAERSATCRPSCPYCGSCPDYCDCQLQTAKMREANPTIGDDELLIVMQRKFASSDRYHAKQGEIEHRRKGRRERLERANQATLPAARNGTNSTEENQGLADHQIHPRSPPRSPMKREKFGGRYLPRRRGPTRKIAEPLEAAE